MEIFVCQNTVQYTQCALSGSENLHFLTCRKRFFFLYIWNAIHCIIRSTVFPSQRLIFLKINQHCRNILFLPIELLYLTVFLCSLRKQLIFAYDVEKNKFHTHYSLFTKVWWTILQLAWLFFFVLYLYFMQYQGLFSLSIYAVPGLFGLTINAVPGLFGLPIQAVPGLFGFPIQAVYLDCLDFQYKP